VHEDKNALCFC